MSDPENRSSEPSPKDKTGDLSEREKERLLGKLTEKFFREERARRDAHILRLGSYTTAPPFIIGFLSLGADRVLSIMAGVTTVAAVELYNWVALRRARRSSQQGESDQSQGGEG